MKKIIWLESKTSKRKKGNTWIEIRFQNRWWALCLCSVRGERLSTRIFHQYQTDREGLRKKERQREKEREENETEDVTRNLHCRCQAQAGSESERWMQISKGNERWERDGSVAAALVSTVNGKEWRKRATNPSNSVQKGSHESSTIQKVL